ncbi:hypothetical protein E2C01_070794 [Portunus trituberculatus]|uniref:Uncharacterized protein n=1 Tax=Portunus trituberculatus TaxID=210409 RepID=A0A5B7I6E4_PORTR|nr:hypothetical protein [Portunus trituberculatus]
MRVCVPKLVTVRKGDGDVVMVMAVIIPVIGRRLVTAGPRNATEVRPAQVSLTAHKTNSHLARKGNQWLRYHH